MRATKMDNKITGPAVAGMNRRKNGQYKKKGKDLEKKGHFVRLTLNIKKQVKRLNLEQVNMADLCRVALGYYLDHCEKTGDRPPLPKIEPLPPKPKINVGERVKTKDGKGRVVSISRGWYRVKLENDEIVFRRLSELQRIL